jgi:hypothetical protein
VIKAQQATENRTCYRSEHPGDSVSHTECRNFRSAEALVVAGSLIANPLEAAAEVVVGMMVAAACRVVERHP